MARLAYFFSNRLRQLQSLVAFVVFSFLALISYSLYESDLFLISSIELEFLSPQSVRFPQEEQKLAEDLRHLVGQKIWQVSLVDLKDLVLSRPWVSQFELVKSWPNKLYVKLDIKKGSFVFEPEGKRLRNQERALPLIVFQDGKFLSKKDVEGAETLPVLRSSLSEFETLFKEANSFLAEMPARGPFSLDMISEFFLSQRNGWVVRLIGVEHEVRMGQEEIALRAQRVNRVLSFLQAREETSSQQSQMFARVIDANLSKKVLVRPRNQP